MTHDFLTQMLGVRRPSVTDVLQPLLWQEIIRHRRGMIAIQATRVGSTSLRMLPDIEGAAARRSGRSRREPLRIR